MIKYDNQYRNRLKQIIELCNNVENKKLNPFSVNVDNLIKILHDCFPELESSEELILDAEAIQSLALVIQHQGNWVKYRSTELYKDPFLLEEKIQRIEKKEIVEIFMKSWNPVIENEKLTTSMIFRAIEYWNKLSPIDERWQKEGPFNDNSDSISKDDLIKLNILAEKTYREELERFSKDLSKKIGSKDRIPFWDFIGAETFQETLDRAQMTSFLISYGYATLELVPLEEQIFIKPCKEVQYHNISQRIVSVPISITYEDWVKWKQGIHT